MIAQTRRRIPHKAALLLYAVLILFGLLLISTPQQNPATAQNNATPTPLPLYALPDARINRAYSSSSIALSSDGRTMISANMINDSATLFIPSFDRVISEIPVGRDPRGAAFTPNGARALVTNRLDGTLSVIDVAQAAVVATIPLEGIWPYGVVTNSDDAAYVSMMGSSEVVVVDLTTNSVRAHIPVADAPAGLALWGDFLYVTHFWSGQISLVYLPRTRAFETVVTGQDTGVFQSVELDITRGIAYLPQTRLNATNPELTYDSTAFPVVNVLNLRDLTTVRSDRIVLDTADQPVNMPFAVALDRFAQRLYVANAGSDSISVIDLNTGRARAHIPVGANPRGVLLNTDNTRLYVHNALEGTITTIDTRDLRAISVLPIIDLHLSLDILVGSQLFHSATDPRLSADGWLSCATCHFDGMSDGRAWQGFNGGARNTPLLYRLPETVPYRWTGVWDELADVEVKIRWLQGGTGLIEPDVSLHPQVSDTNTGASLDLDLLTTYLTSVQPPPIPAPDSVEQFERGKVVFAQQECANCHVGPAGTDLRLYDVGTGGSYDTPSLRWLWMSAPYFHNGSADTLRHVFEMPGQHQLIYTVAPEDIDALVEYLRFFAVE